MIRAKLRDLYGFSEGAGHQIPIDIPSKHSQTAPGRTSFWAQ
jgi:hypothetical protein